MSLRYRIDILQKSRKKFTTGEGRAGCGGLSAAVLSPQTKKGGVPTLQLLDIHGSSYDILDLLEIGFHGGVARYNN